MTDVADTVDGAVLAGRAREAWGPFRHGGVTHIGLNGLRRVAPSGWTFGGLVAHVAAWHEATADRFEQYAASGQMPPPPDDDETYNREVADAASGKPPTRLLAELDASFERVIAVAERLSREQVTANERWAEAVFAGNTYEHYEEHRDEVRSARPTTAAALGARFDSDWTVLRATVDRIVEGARFDDRFNEGWRNREAVAHINGWLREAVRVLPEFRAGRPTDYGEDEVQATNERSVADRRSHSDEELIAELDSAARELRAAIDDLRDEELANPRLLGIVAWCSYLHWDEHLAELGADV